MNISLHKLLPLPLKEKLLSNSSDIWLKELLLKKGERVFVQAPSGTGKTTLIHFLYGIRTDFEGCLEWGAYDAGKIQAQELAALRSMYISVVFQDLRLFPQLTVWENLELKRTLTHVASSEKVMDMLDRLGIADKKEQTIQKLSYGERQRVAIVRALLQPFDWLLMDEPFSHLDQVNIEKAAGLIEEVVNVNKAGLLLADLEKNTVFPYHKIFFL